MARPARPILAALLVATAAGILRRREPEAWPPEVPAAHQPPAHSAVPNDVSLGYESAAQAPPAAQSAAPSTQRVPEAWPPEEPAALQPPPMRAPVPNDVHVPESTPAAQSVTPATQRVPEAWPAEEPAALQPPPVVHNDVNLGYESASEVAPEARGLAGTIQHRTESDRRVSAEVAQKLERDGKGAADAARMQERQDAQVVPAPPRVPLEQLAPDLAAALPEGPDGMPQHTVFLAQPEAWPAEEPAAVPPPPPSKHAVKGEASSAPPADAPVVGGLARSIQRGVDRDRRQSAEVSRELELDGKRAAAQAAARAQKEAAEAAEAAERAPKIPLEKMTPDVAASLPEK